MNNTDDIPVVDVELGMDGVHWDEVHWDVAHVHVHGSIVDSIVGEDIVDIRSFLMYTYYDNKR